MSILDTQYVREYLILWRGNVRSPKAKAEKCRAILQFQGVRDVDLPHQISATDALRSVYFRRTPDSSYFTRVLRQDWRLERR